MKTSKSKVAFERARRLIPGGVNSPARAFRAVGASPLFIASAKGSKIIDIDGNSYIDYVGSWGPMLHGHNHPAIAKAVAQALEHGTSFGAPTLMETDLARLVTRLVPSAEMVRFVNSGTEAAMSALRLARGVTGRDKVIKFNGAYHGHHDCLLVAAGSGAATHGRPNSAGVPRDFAKHTLLAEFNDERAVREIFARNARDIAAVIVEPVIGNSGVIPPENGFLEFLRKITRRHRSLLVFDEVMTGFRLAPGGAQELYGVMPDITVLGKIIGGGLPVGAYAASRKIMRHVAPDGPVYQAGTLSGNPLAMVAGCASLSLVKKSVYALLERHTQELCVGLSAALAKAGVLHVINQVGSMFTIFFVDAPRVTNARTAQTADTEKFAAFFRGMLKAGIYLPCSQFEAAFVSTAHSTEDLQRTIDAAETVAGRLG